MPLTAAKLRLCAQEPTVVTVHGSMHDIIDGRMHELHTVAAQPQAGTTCECMLGVSQALAGCKVKWANAM